MATASLHSPSLFHGLYTGSDGRPSPFDVHLAAGDSGAPLVVFAHGYKGFKDWGCWNKVAREFAHAGIDFLKFNFSHNGGTVHDPIDFPDLEAFAKNTYSKEVADLHTIVRMAANGIELGGQERTWHRIIPIGHSRGGGIATLVAARQPSTTGLVTWASVADFGGRFSFDLEEWKEKGVVTVRNGRTGQEMPHYFSFYEDYEAHQQDLNILRAAATINLPALVVHGAADEVVPIDQAERLAGALPKARLLRIAGAGHTFGASHPWTAEQWPSPLKQVVEETILFVQSIR